MFLSHWLFLIFSLFFLLAFIEHIPLVLSFHHFWFELPFPLSVLFNPLMDKVFGLYGFWIVRVPIFIVSFEETKWEINIVNDMLNFSSDFLHFLLFFPLLLNLCFLKLLKMIPANEFPAFNFGTDSCDFLIEKFVNIVELIIFVIGQPHHMQIGLAGRYERMICYFLPGLGNDLNGFLYFGMVGVLVEQGLQNCGTWIHKMQLFY